MVAPTTVPKRNLIIVNRLGLHARAAAKFVERAQSFSSTISIGVAKQPAANVEWVDGKSIMGVMLLAAGQGTEIELRAEGHDAKDALDAIDALIADKFGESQ